MKKLLRKLGLWLVRITDEPATDWSETRLAELEEYSGVNSESPSTSLQNQQYIEGVPNELLSRLSSQTNLQPPFGSGIAQGGIGQAVAGPRNIWMHSGMDLSYSPPPAPIEEPERKMDI